MSPEDTPLDTAESVQADQEAPATVNAVIVQIKRLENGDHELTVSSSGDVRATEVQTILQQAAKLVRGKLGLSE